MLVKLTSNYSSSSFLNLGHWLSFISDVHSVLSLLNRSHFAVVSVLVCERESYSRCPHNIYQVKIWQDFKAQPVAVLRPHDGHPVNSATFVTSPERSDHVILITGVIILYQYSDFF